MVTAKKSQKKQLKYREGKDQARGNTYNNKKRKYNENRNAHMQKLNQSRVESNNNEKGQKKNENGN